MRQQFLRFYAGIIIALVLVAEVVFFAVFRQFELGLDEKLESAVAPLIGILAGKITDTADDPQGRSEYLASINSVSPYSIYIADRHKLALSAPHLEKISKGQLVSVRSGNTRILYAKAKGNEVLAIGPIGYQSARRPLIILLLMPVAGVILIGTMVVMLIRPIERRIGFLTEAAKKFGAGDLQFRAKTGSGGSIYELEEAFNWMAGRIERLMKGQKELFRAASHDLRTPLTRLFFALEAAQDSATIEEKDRHLQVIDKNLSEMNEFVEELLTFLKLDRDAVKPEKSLIDLTPLLEEAAELARNLRKDVNVKVVCKKYEIRANNGYVKRALSNLITNAATHAKSSIQIACETGLDNTRIAVEDDGPGVSPEHFEKIFEPFFRVDQSRDATTGGAGLGLSIVKRIMDWHNGSVSVKQAAGGGAIFTIEFPSDQ